MRFFAAAFTFFTLAGSALSASIPLTVTKYNGETSGQHIVQVVEGADRATLIQQIKAANGQITYDLPIIHGFAGSFSDAVMKMILSSPVVKSVSEDGVMYTSNSETQPNAPWGLHRISHSDTLKGKDSNLLAYEYYHPDSSLGEGVNVYIVDTGIQTTHKAFGGRAKWGATFGPYLPIDGNGHGTHVAGTAAGRQYGVSQKANIIAVKVMSDLGLGFTSDIVAGLNWIKEQHEKKNNPSVVNMSLGGSTDQALDDAVRSLTTAGVHVAVAAGNSNVDAGETSPAREPSAVTVAASTINDERASFSSFGKVVDIFAPGVNITSAWIGLTNSDTKTISGTSMATPHIAGLIAYLLEAEGPRSPAAMSDRLQQLALKNVLSGVPTDTVNYLAQNH